MSKLNVLKVDWVNDQEVHIYPPGGDSAWWARPVPKNFGDGELWELNAPAELGADEPEGYFETPEDAVQYLARVHYDDAPIVITRERDR